MNLRAIGIGSRLMLTTVGALVLMIAFVAIGVVNLSRVSDQAHAVVANRGHKLQLADDMRQHGLLIGSTLQIALLHETPAAVGEDRKAIAAQLDRYLAAEKEIDRLTVSEQGRALVAKIAAARQAAIASVDKTMGLLADGRRADGQAQFLAETSPLLASWLAPVGEYVALQRQRTEETLAAVDETRHDTGLLMLGLIVLAAAIMIPSGIVVARSIVSPLGRAATLADAIAGGKLDNAVEAGGKDEVSALLAALERMQQSLSDRLAAEHEIADENAAIRHALDFATTNVRICDNDGRITYVNRTLQKTLKRIEAGIRQRQPDFTAETMVGRNIGLFYDDPAAAVEALRRLSSERRFDMDIGGRQYLVVTNPILNAAGDRLGSVAEWVDQTEALRAQQEITRIVDAGRNGDLSERIDPEGKTGFFAALAEGVNELLETTQQALMTTSGVLGAIARGDLTQTIQADYGGIFGQLRDDANGTVVRLREVVGRIKVATDTINTAAREIAAGNADLSRRTEEQASNLEETAASMEQLNATVKQNADNARQANQLAQNSNEFASKGGDAVKKVVTTMEEIQASSKKIADIVGVIDSIAFQTNILALNAAVEAARAGEQGRGFAVVATEVRSLAQRSAQAAKEIKGLIAESVAKVTSGTDLVHQAGETMDDVVTSFQLVANLMTEIAEASREQASGIGQVTHAVAQMDETTQQNAALVEEAAAAAESLEDQAHGLAEAVGSFKLGSAAAPVAARSLRERPASGRSAGARAKRLQLARPEPAADEWTEF